MAPDAIVMKVSELLGTPVDSECKVVYLLCEIRKLLERVPAPDRPFALNMYCHWALHVDLHGRDTITPFLKQVDACLHGTLSGAEDIVASHRLMRDFVFFDTFKNQLRDFLRASGIPSTLTDHDVAWKEFVKHYAGVIEDGSLSLRPAANGLRYVKQVTFTKGNNIVGEFTYTPFKMTWNVTLLDDRKIDIDVSARPGRDGDSPMIAWGIHLR